MGDKSGRLVLTALTRAAADPSGVPLFATRTSPGLFPSSALGRQAAKRCRDEGWLAGEADDDLGTLTPGGMEYLLEESSPREVLEDFVRVIESREGQVRTLLDTARRMQTSLDAVKRTLTDVLARMDAPPDNRLCRDFHSAPAAILPEAIVTALCNRTGSGDCPLPELYRLVTPEPGKAPGLGAFHDALRALHEEECVWLHPWTAPLHEMPVPCFALLIGHEVAYYASPRVRAGGSK